MQFIKQNCRLYLIGLGYIINSNRIYYLSKKNKIGSLSNFIVPFRYPYRYISGIFQLQTDFRSQQLKFDFFVIQFTLNNGQNLTVKYYMKRFKQINVSERRLESITVPATVTLLRCTLYTQSTVYQLLLKDFEKQFFKKKVIFQQ